jgi:inhibitor of cysteine peptidase
MLVIDQSRNDSVAEIRVGETVRIQLSENPTTGFRWRLQADGAPALRLIQDTFEASGSAPGSGGSRCWTFAADHPGSIELRMELQRSWQPQPVRSFGITLDVKAG